MGRGDEARLEEMLKRRDVACPSCGYNLRGLAEGVCPECGFGFDAAWLESQDEVFPIHWTAVASSFPVMGASSVATGIVHFALTPTFGFTLVLAGWIGLGWMIVVRGLLNHEARGARQWLAAVVHVGLALSIFSVLRRLVVGW